MSVTNHPERNPVSAAPLAGVTVLDLTHFLAGPFATLVLADLGARVVKVERPDGDVTRTFPPHFVRGMSAYFLSVNRNKQSAAINLKHPAGRDVLLRLAEQADIMIESWRPGALERLGLAYEAVRDRNPALVHCSITGFGSDGPYRERPAYDAVIQALSGGMSITGEPGRPPVRAGIPIGDLAAGLFAATGCLGALYEVRKTGVGRHIDVSMLDSQISMLSYQAMYYLVSGEVPQPQGRGHDSIPTYRSFTCADGVDIVITANTEKMWHAVCRALERPELAEDARFLNGRLRYENRHALWDLLESAFAAEQAAALLPRLLAHGVPAAQINTIADALVDPQVEHRRMVRPVAHPGGDLVTRFLGNPIKFGPEVEPQWPSELGADTERVLRDLAGMSDADLAELQADDVIAPPPLPASAVTSEEGQERGTSSAGSGRRSIRRGRRHSQDRRGVK